MFLDMEANWPLKPPETRTHNFTVELHGEYCHLLYQQNHLKDDPIEKTLNYFIFIFFQRKKDNDANIGEHSVKLTTSKNPQPDVHVNIQSMHSMMTPVENPKAIYTTALAFKIICWSFSFEPQTDGPSYFSAP